MLGGDILGGDVGLAISNCILLTGMLQWGVRQSAEVRIRTRILLLPSEIIDFDMTLDSYLFNSSNANILCEQ